MNTDGSDPAETRPTTSCRLCRPVALWVFLLALVAVAVLRVPAYFESHQNRLAQARAGAETAVMAALGTRDPAASTRILGQAGNLLAASDIVGAAVFEAKGAKIGAFGEPTHLRTAGNGVVGRDWLDADAGRYEFTLFGEIPDTPFRIVLRLAINEPDTPGLGSLIGRVLAMALVFGGSLFAVVWWFLLRPLTKTGSRVAAILNAPTRTAAIPMAAVRDDEFGDLDRGLEELSILLSTVYREDAVAFRDQAEQSSLCIVAFDADGIVTFANPSARKLSGVRSVHTLKLREIPVISLTPGGHPVDFPDWVARPGLSEGYVKTVDGEHACLFGVQSINRADGTCRRLFVTFVEREAAKKQEIEREYRLRILESTVANQRASVGQCLMLLEAARYPDKARTNARPIDLGVITQEWKRGTRVPGWLTDRAVKVGAMAPVLADRDDMENLIDQVFTVFLAHLPHANVHMAIRCGKPERTTERIVFELGLQQAVSASKMPPPREETARTRITLGLAVVHMLVEKMAARSSKTN